MSLRIPVFIALGAILVIGAAQSAFATNGYFTHGTGTKNKGMVGAGIALPQDAVDTVNNPAVGVLIGENMQIGAALFSPRRTYETGPSQLMGAYPAYTFGEQRVDSDSEYFVIPHFARSWQRSEDTAFTLAFYGRGGMNTDWNGGTAMFDPDGPMPNFPVVTLPGTFGDGPAGVDLSQAFLDLGWSKQINDTTSVGLAAIFAMQLFEAKGVGNFGGFTKHFAASGGTSFPTKLSDNGHDQSYGYGAKFGIHKQVSDQTAFGIMYQTKLKMSDFDDYADLFAQAGGFDIPANMKLGVTFKPRENLAVSFDIEHTWFSDVDSVGNSIMNLFSCPTSPAMGPDLEGCLGGERGAGFGWDDMTTYKIGFQWSKGDDWTWRAGYSHGDQPIPSTEMTFNILAPGVMENHFTFGFTRDRGNGREINFAFMYAPTSDQTGPNNFDPTQTIMFEMDQFELELSYGWRY